MVMEHGFIVAACKPRHEAVKVASYWVAWATLLGVGEDRVAA
jgi:hypothetical protein